MDDDRRSKRIEGQMIRTERIEDNQVGERCAFCLEPTQDWAILRDVPVCGICAGQYKEKDLPTKEEWILKELSYEHHISAKGHSTFN
jgi:hypothetical protein